MKDRVQRFSTSSSWQGIAGAAVEWTGRRSGEPSPQRVEPCCDREQPDLAHVRGVIRRHIERLEESRALVDEIQDHAPRLARRAEALERDRAGLTRRAVRLAEQLSDGSAADFEALRREAARLWTDLRAHRSAEADLIYDAFWTDSGAGD